MANTIEETEKVSRVEYAGYVMYVHAMNEPSKYALRNANRKINVMMNRRTASR